MHLLAPSLPPLNTYFFVFWEKNPNTTILYSNKQRPSVHGHALPRGRSSVWFPAKQTGPTRRYGFPFDLRSQTVRAWLVLVGNQHYCCVVWLLHCWFFSSWLMNSCSKRSLPGSNSGKGFIYCQFCFSYGLLIFYRNFPMSSFLITANKFLLYAATLLM